MARSRILTADTRPSIPSVPDRIAQSFQAISDFFVTFSRWVKHGALWIGHLPSRIATSITQTLEHIRHAFASAGRAILYAFVIAIKAIAVLLLTGASICLLHFLLPKLIKRCMEWQRRRRQRKEYQEQQRRADEYHEHLRREREEEARRLSQEREAQERVQRKEADQERLKKEEQDRKRRQEEQQRSKEEQKQRRENVFRWQEAEEAKKAYQTWQTHRMGVLKCKGTMTNFPEPPSWPCINVKDPCRGDRHLQACKHSIERLYRAADSDYKEILAIEKTVWHPDKFHACPPAGKEQIEMKATELFQIICNLLDSDGGRV